MDAGILQVLIGQFYRSVSHVDLAGDDVGDEAGAVLVHQVDLALRSVDGLVNLEGHSIIANPHWSFLRTRESRRSRQLGPVGNGSSVRGKTPEFRIIERPCYEYGVC